MNMAPVAIYTTDERVTLKRISFLGGDRED
jgi:hypothetical protein